MTDKHASLLRSQPGEESVPPPQAEPVKPFCTGWGSGPREALSIGTGYNPFQLEDVPTYTAVSGGNGIIGHACRRFYSGAHPGSVVNPPEKLA